MPRQRKFTKGPRIEGVISAIAQINAGNWMYHNHKVLSPRWLENWSIAQIRQAVVFGCLFYAIPTKGEEHHADKQVFSD